MTIDAALTKAGGFGRYQCFLLLVMIMSMNGPGLVVYGVAYYELQPPYTCTYLVDSSDFEVNFDNDTEISTVEQPCNYTTVCDADAMDTTLISYKVDTTG